MRQNPPKSPKPRCLLDMAVWPDPAHGKCSYGYVKMSFLTFRKVNIFDNVEHLHLFLFCCFQGLPAGCVCVRAACGASATSEKKTPLDFGTCVLWMLWFLSDFKPLVCFYKYGRSDQMTMPARHASKFYARSRSQCPEMFFSRADFFGNSGNDRTLARMSTWTIPGVMPRDWKELTRVLPGRKLKARL